MKKLQIFIVSLLLILGLAVGAQATPTVWFDISDAGPNGEYLGGDKISDTRWALDPGGTIWVDIYASGIKSWPFMGLVKMGVNTYYDPTQLEVTDGTKIDWRKWYLGPGVETSDPGVVDMKGRRIFPGLQGDNIHLGVIELHCIQPGVSYLTMDDHDNYNDFVLLNGRVLDESVQFSSAQIVNTPIPGAFLLFGSGLLGLAGLRRKFRK